MKDAFTAMRGHLAPDAVITDGGSSKGSVVADAEAAFGDLPAMLVPGHPIAGTERNGVEASFAGLYRDRRVILTPTDTTSPEATARVRAMWEACGAEVSEMSVEHHDEVLAATSHLPHMLAFGLVDALSRMKENDEIFRYAAGGFRDFTRIASSNPVMWRDVCVANGPALSKMLAAFAEEMNDLAQTIAAGDGEHLLEVFTRAKEARDRFVDGLPSRQSTEQIILSNSNISFHVSSGGALKGHLRVPGDKSISHRSIMLGSLAEGITHVSGFLEGEDSLATLNAFRQMGVLIEGPENGRVVIHGVGMQGLKTPDGALDLGNSGTSMRLLAGLLAGQGLDLTLTGDASLSSRPMRRVTDPLMLMGAQVETTEAGTAPLHIRPVDTLRAIDYELPVASAQVKSCVLLAGLYADGETCVTEPAPTRDHTERMLRGFGYEVQRNGNRVCLRGGGKLTACDIDVPADISSAAFFLVGASIAPGSDLTLEHVGMNPTRDGIITILRLMGADIEIQNERDVGGEPVADLRVRHAPLKGIRIPEDQVPLAIDEFPAVFVAAACAEGETVLTGAEELRVKESDRIQVMADGLQTLGVDARSTPDGMIIKGGPFHGGEVESHGDHRIAMSFAMAALRADGDIHIRDCANVNTSFPAFDRIAGKAGLHVEVKHG